MLVEFHLAEGRKILQFDSEKPFFLQKEILAG